MYIYMKMYIDEKTQGIHRIDFICWNICQRF